MPLTALTLSYIFKNKQKKVKEKNTEECDILVDKILIITRPLQGIMKGEKKQEQEESVSVKVILNKEYQKTFERAFIPNS